MSDEHSRQHAPVRRTTGFAVETALTLALGAIGAYEGYRLAQQPLLWRDPVGPGWFLFWVSVLMIVLGLVRIARPASPPDPVADGGEEGPLSVTGPAFRLLGLFVAYVAVMSLTGYEIASFLFFTAALKVAGFATWRNSLLVGAIVTAGFVLFARELNIYLP